MDWFAQIALALRHCHERRILHRDLKSKNVFLTSRNFVKLGDFGISKMLSNTADKARTIIGTPYYLSPEIIQNRPYGLESDIWSLGVLLYEMCALKPPFNAYSISALAMKITGGAFQQIPGQYSKDLKLLVASMLAVDPRRRPNIHKILRNPFIQARIEILLKQTLYNLKLTSNITGKPIDDHKKPQGPHDQSSIEHKKIKDKRMNPKPPIPSTQEKKLPTPHTQEKKLSIPHTEEKKLLIPRQKNLFLL